MDDHGCSQAGDAGDQHHRDARGHAQQVQSTGETRKERMEGEFHPLGETAVRRDRDALRIAGRRDPAVEQPVPLGESVEQRRAAGAVEPGQHDQLHQHAAGSDTGRHNHVADEVRHERGRIARPVQPLQTPRGICPISDDLGAGSGVGRHAAI